MLRVAAVQMEPRFAEVATNLATATRLVRSQPADLYVLPELFNTGYLFHDRSELASLAEAYPAGSTCRELALLSGGAGAVIAAGFAESTHDGRLYNSVALFDRGHPIGCYRKIHLFDTEFLIFDPGDAPPRVLNSSHGRLGPMVCFDWFFPEVARCLALAGAQLLVHAANLVLPYCQNTMPARCVENRVYAVTANRVGTESRHGRETSFTGASQILGVRGECLAQASVDREEVIVAAVNLAQADEKAITPRNHILGDRRPGLYKRLTDASATSWPGDG
jgi:predicted amidohydrolase